jgi:predicted DNA binding CopG/RHH family protein
VKRKFIRKDWVIDVREEYDIKNLNPKKNPYSNRLKKQITININCNTIDYFQEQSQESGIPYQTLINLYLSDCAEHKRKLDISWK